MTCALPMIEHPILFSGPMVRAILDGRKTMTRRIVKPRHVDGDRCAVRAPDCPYGRPGDHLWVRESWAARLDQDHIAPRDLPQHGVGYWADGPGKCCNTGCAGAAGKVRPGIFMPRWASRITLELTGVRVERLQAISAKDIIAEGAVARAHDDQFGHNPVSAFDGCVYLDLKSLWAAGWNKINGKRAPWASNPFVWVLEFKRLNAATKE